MPDGEQRAFEQVLRDIEPVDRRERVASPLGAPVLLHSLSRTRSGGFWQGDLVRIRMDALPSVASLKGTLDSLDLEDDEGLGEESAFLFDPQRQILVLQKNHYGVSIPAFVRYFEEIADLPGPLVADPVLHKNAYERLAQFPIYRKIEVHLAATTNLEYLRHCDPSANRMLDLISDAEAPRASFVLSMGHHRGSLIRDWVRRIVDTLGHAAGNEVTTLRVHASDGEGHRELIDLLEYRMEAIDKIEPGLDRRLPQDQRISAVTKAWRANREELNHLFL